jgi:rare lipoprotein A
MDRYALGLSIFIQPMKRSLGTPLVIPLAILLATLLALATLCLGKPSGRQASTKGVASYYGVKFKGKRTAYGEVFDPDALTCASRHYKYGAMLLVKYPKGGTSVTVRVNDRGPSVSGRILDLSERAATILGIRKVGIAWVEIIPVEGQ